MSRTGALFRPPRGRGDSGDNADTFAVEREIEDLAALIAAAGGRASLFGHSSGGILALEAAAQGLPIERLVVYETPFVVGALRPPPAEGTADRIRTLIAEEHRDDAVRLFLTEQVAVPAELVDGRVVAQDWGCAGPGQLASANSLIPAPARLSFPPRPARVPDTRIDRHVHFPCGGIMRVPTVAVLTLAGLGLAVGGCAGTEPGEPGSTTGTTTSAAPEPTASGTASGCMVGTWRTTQVSGRASSAAASGNISGGNGATVTISPGGQVRADFSGMQPLSFTAEVAGNQVEGSATYGGQGTATIKASGSSTPATGSPASSVPATPGTPPVPSASPSATATATATPAPAAEEGTWEPVGAIDWSALRLTLELTKPVQARLLDNAPIGDYIDDAANQSGKAIETDPILGAGAYSCQGSTLILKGDTDNDGLTWTLTKI